MNAVHVVPLHDTIDHEVPGGLDRVLPDAVGDRGGDLDVRWIGVPEGFDRDRHVAARPERQKVLTSGRKFRFALRLRVFEQAGDEQQQKIRAALSDTVSVRLLDDDASFGTATIGFIIYVIAGVDIAVGMELPHGRHEVSDAEGLPVYRALLDDMYSAATPLEGGAT